MLFWTNKDVNIRLRIGMFSFKYFYVFLFLFLFIRNGILYLIIKFISQFICNNVTFRSSCELLKIFIFHLQPKNWKVFYYMWALHTHIYIQVKWLSFFVYHLFKLLVVCLLQVENHYIKLYVEMHTSVLRMLTWMVNTSGVFMGVVLGVYTPPPKKKHIYQ